MKKPVRFPKVEWEVKVEKPRGNFYPTVEINFGFEVKEGELWWRPKTPQIVLLLGKVSNEEAFTEIFRSVEERKYLYQSVNSGTVKVYRYGSAEAPYGAHEVSFKEGDYCLVIPQELLDSDLYLKLEKGETCLYLVLLSRAYYSSPKIAEETLAQMGYCLHERFELETYRKDEAQEYAAVLAEMFEEATSLFPDVFKDGLEEEKEGFTFYRSSKTKNLSVQVIHNQTEQQVAEFV